MTVKMLQKGNYHIRLTVVWCKVKRMSNCHFGSRVERNCFSLVVFRKKPVKHPDKMMCKNALKFFLLCLSFGNQSTHCNSGNTHFFYIIFFTQKSQSCIGRQLHSQIL